MKIKNLYRIVAAILIFAICTCDVSQYVSAVSQDSTNNSEQASENEDSLEETESSENEQTSKENSVIEKTVDTTTYETEDGDTKQYIPDTLSGDTTIEIIEEQAEIIKGNKEVCKIDAEADYRSSKFSNYYRCRNYN